MIYLLYALALTVTLILIRRHQNFKHLAIYYGGAALIATLLNYCSSRIEEHSKTTDTETLSYLTRSATYYEEWDEWINATCSRTCCCDSKGGNCKTEYYDCSYRKHHPEEYVARYENAGVIEAVEISREEYREIVKAFKQKEVFEELDRYYYTIDGDAWHTSWDLTPANSYTLYLRHKYENRIINSTSIYNYPELSESDLARVYEWQNYTSIYGNNSNKKLDYLNGLYGQKYQIKINFIYFNSPNRELGHLQEAAWKGGNKNELNICIGQYDTQRWAHVFCWDNTELKTQLQKYIETNNPTQDQLIKYLEQEIPKKWKRKSFVDFQYIEVPTSYWYGIVYFFLLIVFYLVYYYVTNRR